MILPILAGQATRPVHPRHAARTSDERPVTQGEARAAFTRVARILSRLNGRDLGEASIQEGDRPASREQILAEMLRLYRSSESAIRFVPVPVAYDPRPFRVAAGTLPALNSLVGHGLVARLGPLAVGPQPGLDSRQFGDAVGFFASRLAQITQLPSPKWTPSLKGD